MSRSHFSPCAIFTRTNPSKIPTKILQRSLKDPSRLTRCQWIVWRIPQESLKDLLDIPERSLKDPWKIPERSLKDPSRIPQRSLTFDKTPTSCLKNPVKDPWGMALASESLINDEGSHSISQGSLGYQTIPNCNQELGTGISSNPSDQCHKPEKNDPESSPSPTILTNPNPRLRMPKNPVAEDPGWSQRTSRNGYEILFKVHFR